MKKILLFILSLWCVSAMSQSKGYLRYDSLYIQKIGGNATLIIENATRGVTNGVLTNIGNGRTAFVTPSGGSNTSIGSGFKIGVDGTNNIKSFTATNGLTADSLTAGQVGIKLGGTLNGVTDININSNNFSIKNGATTLLRFDPSLGLFSETDAYFINGDIALVNAGSEATISMQVGGGVHQVNISSPYQSQDVDIYLPNMGGYPGFLGTLAGKVNSRYAKHDGEIELPLVDSIWRIPGKDSIFYNHYSVTGVGEAAVGGFVTRAIKDSVGAGSQGLQSVITNDPVLTSGATNYVDINGGTLGLTFGSTPGSEAGVYISEDNNRISVMGSGGNFHFDASTNTNNTYIGNGSSSDPLGARMYPDSMIVGKVNSGNLVRMKFTTDSIMLKRISTGIIDTTNNKPLAINTPSGGIVQMNSWAQVSGGGSSGLTVGTTPITSGTGGRILYETSGNVLGQTTTTSTGSDLLVNTTSATDPITGNGVFAAVDGTMRLSFRDHVAGQGYLAISNGTMTGYVGHTNATNGFTLGTISSHSVSLTQGNAVKMHIDNASHIAFGGSLAPSAQVQFPVGSASATYAPTKYVTGPILTTAEAGVIEYNGTHYTTKASGLRFASEGTIADFYTDVNNSGTGETDIYTYTTPASTLANDGEKVFFNYTLNLTDITATATIKCYFAGTAIANTGALTVSATGAVIVTGWIIRTSSTTARASVNIASPTASTAVYTSQTDLTGLTLSGTNIVKVTAQAGGGTGGSNDIVGKSGTVSWRGVAAN